MRVTKTIMELEEVHMMVLEFLKWNLGNNSLLNSTADVFLRLLDAENVDLMGILY